MERVPLRFAPSPINSITTKAICGVVLYAACFFFPMKLKGVPCLLLSDQGSNSKTSFLLTVAAIVCIYSNHIKATFFFRASRIASIVGAGCPTHPSFGWVGRVQSVPAPNP